MIFVRKIRCFLHKFFKYILKNILCLRHAFAIRICQLENSVLILLVTFQYTILIYLFLSSALPTYFCLSVCSRDISFTNKTIAHTEISQKLEKLAKNTPAITISYFGYITFPFHIDTRPMIALPYDHSAAFS